MESTLKEEANNTHHQVIFPGLTSIRGVASLVVLVCHIDQFHYLFAYNSVGLMLTGLGEDAVTMFFVLSGFLITFLLLKEKKMTGRINITFFYIRRILRIWPVYYVALFTSLLLMYLGIIPKLPNTEVAILLYLFFAANVAYVSGYVIRAVVPLWSVGVEEQFYAIWPWIIEKSKNVLISMVGVIVLYVFLKVIVWHIDQQGGEYALLRVTRIDCMAIGGLFAYYHWQNLIPKILYTWWIQLLCISSVIGLSFFNVAFIYDLDDELKALLFGSVILMLAVGRVRNLRFFDSAFHFLGTISYGLYSYHMIVIFLVAFYVNKFELVLIKQNEWIAAFIVCSLSVLVSYVSYRFIEKPILKFKKLFTAV